MGIAPSSQAASLPSAEQTAEPNTPQVLIGESIEITTPTSLDIQIKSTERSSMDNNQPDSDRLAQDRHISDTQQPISDASMTSTLSESENQQSEVFIDSAPAVYVDNEQMTRHEPERDGNQSLAEFKEELRVKREQRISAIADLKNEVLKLRQDLAIEREISNQLRAKQTKESSIQENLTHDDGSDTTDHSASMFNEAALNLVASNEGSVIADIAATTTTLREQLADANHDLQLANAENLSVSTELTITQRQVASLKEVIVVTKEMVAIRESQLEQVCI